MKRIYLESPKAIVLVSDETYYDWKEACEDNGGYPDIYMFPNKDFGRSLESLLSNALDIIYAFDFGECDDDDIKQPDDDTYIDAWLSFAFDKEA